MAVKSVTSFKYTVDEKKTYEQNMQEIFTHIQNTILNNSGVPFTITLDLEAEPMDTEEVNKLVADAVEEATEMEKNTMVPTAVDQDGTATYKRKADIKE